MIQWLWIIPVLPFTGFLLLALSGARLPRRLVAVVGAGSVGLSAMAALMVALDFLTGTSPHAYKQTLWVWWRVDGFQPAVTLYLDALSVVMILVITVVGFLIHLYSTEFMIGDSGYSRFFAYMNLFVGFMLILVLADNLVFLYLGWEGVGLCSYLLIGFWYKEPRNGYAARKAFVVTRIGDTAMAVGLFLLFNQLGTLHIQDLMMRAQQTWPSGSIYPVAAALLLLGGAAGKSAQLPLQTWLPDAMAGPSPVSALIHAATMVTAGVYLIARTHVLFTLAPKVMALVAILGAVTLLLAGFSGLVQRDIKRVLAYSTISQIGYMFLALGVGAWAAAIFHFMVHAFFKALLFLGAGAVIQALDEEHDMFKMGGLRQQMPVTFWTFLIGSSSLSAIPLITAGFYSKDQIIWLAYSSVFGSGWLWTAALAGALLTSLYTFRLVFRVFFGSPRSQIKHHPGPAMKISLVVLAIFSIAGGFIELPKSLGNLHLFSDFLQSTLPSPFVAKGRGALETMFEIISMAVSLGGVFLVYLFIFRMPRLTQRLAQSSMGAFLYGFWFGGWGFDTFYDYLITRPYVWVARVNRHDFIDGLFTAVAWINRTGYRTIRRTQTGRLRGYAMGIAAGAILIIGMAVLL